jgi:hypothetical protein
VQCPYILTKVRPNHERTNHNLGDKERHGRHGKDSNLYRLRPASKAQVQSIQNKQPYYGSNIAVEHVVHL